MSYRFDNDFRRSIRLDHLNMHLNTFLSTHCRKFNIQENVFYTTKLDAFRFLDDNRDVNPAHVDALVKSFKEKYLPTIIYVNEYMQIIDGQHRVEAARKTQKPVYFYIQPGWGIKEVRILNVNSKNWSGEDFMISFARSGNENYLRFKDVFEKFSFPITSLLMIIKNDPDNRGADSKVIFNKGKLIFTEEMATDVTVRASRVEEVGAFHPQGKSKMTFVSACLSMFKATGYDHKLFLGQLRKYPDELLTNSTRLSEPMYKEIFKRVYNYKRRLENRLDW